MYVPAADCIQSADCIPGALIYDCRGLRFSFQGLYFLSPGAVNLNI